jgi:predicted O-linked N-acetylglucosamine transferase (SPINDLY family)
MNNVENCKEMVSLGNKALGARQLVEAKNYYLKAFEFNNKSIEALTNLGWVNKELGNIEESESFLLKALELNPNDMDINYLLGSIYIDKKEFKKSIPFLEKTLSIDKGFELGRVALSQSLFQINYIEKSKLVLLEGIGLNPNNIDFNFYLGKIEGHLGNLDDAIRFHGIVANLNPNSEENLISLSILYGKKNNIVEAKKAIQSALKINPKNYMSLCHYADLLAEEGNNDLAIPYYEEIIRGNPTFYVAYNNLGNSLSEIGEIDKSIAVYKKGLDSKEFNVKRQIFTSLFFNLHYSSYYSNEEYFRYLKEFDSFITEGVDKYSYWLKNTSSKIKIGFISGDLNEHPVTFFLENIVKNINKDRFELYAYSTNAKEDDFSKKLKNYFSKWKVLEFVNARESAKTIWDDGVEVLIDLSGHTKKNRLDILAYKPAPTQISWLGYFNSTGLSTIDYVLADDSCVFPGEEKFFTEKVYYLPNTRLCFTPAQFNSRRDNYPTITPAQKNGYITFGCYQNLKKINNEVLNVWSKIIKEVPNSKIRIQSRGLANKKAKENLLKRLKENNINLDRLQLVEEIHREDYLNSYSEVDILLDTFPYTGGTTTCEALYMGVPTLTLNGNNMIARQGATFMSCVGLNDWIAETKEEYVSKAIILSKDISNLNIIRMTLRDKMLKSPIANHEVFMKNFEKAILEIYEECRPK